MVLLLPTETAPKFKLLLETAISVLELLLLAGESPWQLVSRMRHPTEDKRASSLGRGDLLASVLVKVKRGMGESSCSEADFYFRQL
jgi:hypothetical protein